MTVKKEKKDSISVKENLKIYLYLYKLIATMIENKM